MKILGILMLCIVVSSSAMASSGLISITRSEGNHITILDLCNGDVIQFLSIYQYGGAVMSSDMSSEVLDSPLYALVRYNYSTIKNMSDASVVNKIESAYAARIKGIVDRQRTIKSHVYKWNATIPDELTNLTGGTR